MNRCHRWNPHWYFLWGWHHSFQECSLIAPFWLYCELFLFTKVAEDITLLSCKMDLIYSKHCCVFSINSFYIIFEEWQYLAWIRCSDVLTWYFRCVLQAPILPVSLSQHLLNKGMVKCAWRWRYLHWQQQYSVELISLLCLSIYRPGRKCLDLGTACVFLKPRRSSLLTMNFTALNLMLLPHPACLFYSSPG